MAHSPLRWVRCKQGREITRSIRERQSAYTSPMAKYVLSAHAETVLAERSIKLEWLERVLSKPAKVEPDKEDAELTHALGRIREHGNRMLRVVYNDSVKPARIVTVYFDRTLRNKP